MTKDFLKNSIWPNGIVERPDDNDNQNTYAFFYKLGYNKIDIEELKLSTNWPKGDELKFPFVYDYRKNEDGTYETDEKGKIVKKLVGFCDTKSIEVTEATPICLPYKHIEADFRSIAKGKLKIYAPNIDTNSKVIWKDGIEETLPNVVNDDDFSYTYKGCINVNAVKSKNEQYNEVVDWEEPLFNMTDITYMFDKNKTITSFKADLPNVTSVQNAFNTSTLVSFEGNLSSLKNGQYMFTNCSSLTTFNSDLSKLTTGTSMFQSCTSLPSFTIDLSKLTDGQQMFYNCTNLTSFASDLSSLTSGKSMFAVCKSLPSFTINLSKLTNGYQMFYTCTNLTSFSSDLSSLTDGYQMFYNCTNLTSFKSNLISLTNGDGMFGNCKLDAPSVKNIIDTINTYSGTLTLGMGCSNTDEADRNLFAQEIGYNTMTELRNAITAKGWTLNTQYTGRPTTTTTYSLRRPSADTLPVFVKLEEVEEHADYTSEDGSKKFRLDWFHETTGSTDGYTQFNTIEEAIESLNIKPIEN